MRWLSVLVCCTLFLGSVDLSGAAQAPVQQLDLTDLAKVVEEVVAAHPGKRAIDEHILLLSHEKLLAAFDPEKIYLLEHEVANFLDSKNGKTFLREYQKGNFQAYFSMLDLCRQAVQRSRSIRRGFFFTDSHSLDMVRKEPPEPHAFYAIDIDELTSRLFHYYMRLIAERLPEDWEGNSKKVQQAVMLAERELELHESEWLKCDTNPRGSEEGNSLAATWILKSIVSALDAHSDVMRGKSVRDIRERLTKESFGTGIVPLVGEKGCFVKKVVQGSPAARLRVIDAGDQIVSIDNRSCSDMTAEEIDQALNSEIGGTVRLEVRKANDKHPVERIVARSRYTVMEGRLEVQTRPFPGGNVLVLSLHSFYRGGAGISSSEDIRKAIQEARTKGSVDGIVLDLRDNGGGYVTEAVRVVGEFIKTGVVMTVRYADGSSLVFRDIDSDIIFSGPIVVLTSKATASAAEIVAQALKDYGRAVIVGDPQTYGKGTIQMQTVTDMTEKGAWANVPMRLTVGRFYTVSGYSPQTAGVKSDVIVPSVYENRKTEEDQSDIGGQDRIDPIFHDTLDDVRADVRGWYHEHYLPFLQERTDMYRKWVPMLQKKSAKRMADNPLLSILAQQALTSDEAVSLKKKAQDLELNEAVAVEVDLIQLSKNQHL